MADTFLHRAALQQTVVASAKKFADRAGKPVDIYRVMGGYEARSTERGEPKGSFDLLERIVPTTRDVPGASAPTPAVLAVAAPIAPIKVVVGSKPSLPLGRPVPTKPLPKATYGDR